MCVREGRSWPFTLRVLRVIAVAIMLAGVTGRAAGKIKELKVREDGEVAASTAFGVRSSDASIVRLLREGNERSATFRALVEALGRSHGIVYVEFGHCAFGHLNGCLLPYVLPSGRVRYLRVVVTPAMLTGNHNVLLPLIAHELRHALEVLDHPEVVDVDTLEALYRRIGIPIARLNSYETSAARSAGDAVLSELSARRK